MRIRFRLTSTRRTDPPSAQYEVLGDQILYPLQIPFFPSSISRPIFSPQQPSLTSQYSNPNASKEILADSHSNSSAHPHRTALAFSLPFYGSAVYIYPHMSVLRPSVNTVDNMTAVGELQTPVSLSSLLSV